MQIAIITSSSHFSTLILSRTVGDTNFNCALAVITPTHGGSRSRLGMLKKTLKTSGIHFVTYKLVSIIASKILGNILTIGKLRVPYTPAKLAATHGIPVRCVDDCNDPDFIRSLKQLDVDLILSVNVYQRMSQELIDCAKYGAINTHFGLLPKYRGISPLLWAVSRGESDVGITIHRMVLNIDEGDIILQKAIPVKPSETLASLSNRCCLEASDMLRGAMYLIVQNSFIGQSQSGEASYFSLPTRQCISDFHSRGHKLWSLTDFLKFTGKTQGVSDL